MAYIDRIINKNNSSNNAKTNSFMANDRDDEEEEGPLNLEAIHNMKIGLPEYDGI